MAMLALAPHQTAHRAYCPTCGNVAVREMGRWQGRTGMQVRFRCMLRHAWSGWIPYLGEESGRSA